MQNSGFQTIHHARKLIKSLRRFSILKLYFFTKPVTTQSVTRYEFAASFKDEKEEVFKEFYI
jgi:hypothetical protein